MVFFLFLFLVKMALAMLIATMRFELMFDIGVVMRFKVIGDDFSF